MILFKCEQIDPIFNVDFPFDKYELEYCPLVQYILERKDSNLCWPVFVANSYKQINSTGGLGHPFGYLKVASNMQSVTLVILPYNYPILMSILEDWKDKKYRSSAQWQNRLERYMMSVPPYYISVRGLNERFRRIWLETEGAGYNRTRIGRLFDIFGRF